MLIVMSYIATQAEIENVVKAVCWSHSESLSVIGNIAGTVTG